MLPIAQELALAKGKEIFIEKIYSSVLDKVKNARAQVFFDQFIKEFVNEKTTGQDSDVLDRTLTRIHKNETAKELLYDAYRRVCLSASKNLGPRIIAILTAKLISEERMATEIEERFFLAAEQLSDTDFIWLKKTYRHALNPNNPQPTTVESLLYAQNVGPTLFTTSKKDRLPLTISKLESLGLVFTSKPQSELTFACMVFKDVIPFIDLIERAQGPENSP